MTSKNIHMMNSWWVLLCLVIVVVKAETVCPIPPNPVCQNSTVRNGQCVVERTQVPCLSLPDSFWMTNETMLNDTARNPLSPYRWIMFMCEYGFEKKHVRCRELVTALLTFKRTLPREKRDWRIGFVDCGRLPEQCAICGASAPYSIPYVKMGYKGVECCEWDAL